MIGNGADKVNDGDCRTLPGNPPEAAHDDSGAGARQGHAVG
jgi:hypothetical protein